MKQAKVRVFKANGMQLPSLKTDSKQQKTEHEEIITPRYDLLLLRQFREISTVLGQCVDAYKRNIAGFGLSQQYIENDNSEESNEMKQEWTRLQTVLKHMSVDKPIKEVFEQAIEHREESGNAFMEVIRDGLGLPAELLNALPETMRVTKYTEPVDVEYIIDGVTVKRRKKFRRFVQLDNGVPVVWFKQFGDPRIMDCRTGKFDDNTPEQYQATEIIHLKIGDDVYGVPRWVSHLIHMSGSRKADELNYLYFVQGRHTPAAIVISNGTLSEDSETALQEYANGIEGVENAHKFIVLEVENVDEYGNKEDEQKSKIEIKSLADLLQEDAMFLDYDKSSRDKVRSAFRLPGVYIGETNDYNRATIKTAKEVAEEQVFMPERETLEFLLNDVLLAPHDLKYTKVVLNTPDLTDIEDQVSMLTVLNDIGSVAPNDTRDLAGKVIGKPLEPFQDEKYDAPMGANTNTPVPLQKAQEGNLVSLMKDIRDVLEELQHAKD